MKKEILLAHWPKINFKRYRELTVAFSNLDNAWRAEFDDLKKLGWKDDLINEFLLWRDALDEKTISRALEKEQIQCVTINDNDYPALLKEIPDPPFCLFIRGNIKNIQNPLAVVGPRKYSAYGKQITEEIVLKLARCNVEIISGLALGIDSIAHNITLQASGRTIAVLGSGINKDNIYPACHKQLSERIINSGGALVSEYPPGTKPNIFTFPKRNRIVAGMSLGTLVIEASEDSGALITAQCALDDNREVFCIPQNITSSTAAGSNKLLKDGAIPVTAADDIINVFNLQELTKNHSHAKIIAANPIEEKILKLLSREPLHVDEIIKNSNVPSQTANSALGLMEIQGKIKNTGGMMYILAT